MVGLNQLVFFFLPTSRSVPNLDCRRGSEFFFSALGSNTARFAKLKTVLRKKNRHQSASDILLVSSPVNSLQ